MSSSPSSWKGSLTIKELKEDPVNPSLKKSFIG